MCMCYVCVLHVLVHVIHLYNIHWLCNIISPIVHTKDVYGIYIDHKAGGCEVPEC